MRRYLSGKYLDDVAIRRIREFEPEALRMSPKGYFLAYSGGKDSDVILQLAKEAKVKFEAVHNLTTADAPETVWYVRSHAEVRIDRPEITMWQLIRKKGMLPLRKVRFCCAALKERGGAGRLTMLGVRWEESIARRGRRMVEACYRDKTKRFVNPIIDWTTADVWEFIRERNLSYCPLYDEGFGRVGCVLCPNNDHVDRDIARWPRLCRAWERAGKATWRPSKGPFKSPEAYWRWWLSRKGIEKGIPGQLVLFEDDPSYGRTDRPPVCPDRTANYAEG